MSISLTLLVIITLTALLFDLINGFHDAANSIATIVSTNVLSPRTAIVWAAFFNFLAMAIFAPKVADTISRLVKIEANDLNYVYVIFMALLAAIVWNLLTWFLALPTSSSHALIGGLAGAGLAYGGVDSLRWEPLTEAFIFIFISPLMGFVLGAFFILALYWILQKCHPAKIHRFFRSGQLVSAALYSLGHGANDAQKTMGIIVALLIASGVYTHDTQLELSNPETRWIIISCQSCLAIGTAFGGWRIVKTMGMRIVKLRPIDGFCAETAGAMTLFFATHLGIPVSTTHTITGAIIGVGSISEHLSRIRWAVAINILYAWLLTIPGAGLIAFLLFSLMKLSAL